MTDPWQRSINQEITTENKETTSTVDETKLEFEDNFSATNITTTINSLPDSQDYIKSLEKKLKKLKANSNIVEQLAEKREECLRNLINETINLDKNYDSIDLDASLVSGESTVYDIYRHICPVQPLSAGETIHILKHDQLANKTEEDSASDSAASR